MSQYSIGTIAVTSGSAVVTGTGTFWAGLTVRQGDYLYLPGTVGRWQVNSVASNTSLTLTAPMTVTATGRSYVIVRDRTPRGYPLMQKGDIETAQIYSDTITQIDAEITSRLGGGTLVRHIESISAATAYPLFVRTPTKIEITKMSYVARTGTQGLSLRVAGTTPTGYSSLAANQTIKTVETAAPAAINTTVDILTAAGAVTATGLTVQIDYRLVL